jgi:hypothetical protein
MSTPDVPQPRRRRGGSRRQRLSVDLLAGALVLLVLAVVGRALGGNGSAHRPHHPAVSSATVASPTPSPADSAAHTAPVLRGVVSFRPSSG